jgi:hypothetical protein
MTLISAGAAIAVANPARSMEVASMGTFSCVSCAALKSVSYTMTHGMRERCAESMIIGRGIGLSWQFRSSRRSVPGTAESVGGILRRMAGAIVWPVRSLSRFTALTESKILGLYRCLLYLHVGVKCLHAFCWVCMTPYNRIRIEGNTAHDRSCNYHSSRFG